VSRVISDRLSQVAVAEPVRKRGLSVFPLVGDDRSPVDYLYLDDALATGGFHVREVDEGGVVGELIVTNDCELPVLIVDGEVLTGGKQNRVINTTVLVAAQTATPIPVSCIEQGRWSSGRGSGHSSSEYHTPGKIRASLKKSTTRSLRESSRATSDQGEIWDDVSDVLHCSGSLSPSSDLSQAYADHAPDLGALEEEFDLPEETVGVVIAVGDEVVAGDVFDRRRTFDRYRPRLLRGAALDALRIGDEDRPQVVRDDVVRLLREAVEAAEESYPSPGLGRDIRVEGPGLVVSALAVEEEAVHVGLFTT
jgi:hypothetical protein